MEQKVRIVIADDHPVVREGLRGMFKRFSDCEVVGEAADGPQAIDVSCTLRPDVALVDLRLPGVDGVAVARTLRQSAPDVAVLILSTFRDETAFLDGLEVGVRGYLLKDAAPDALHKAVLECAGGGMPVDAALAPLLVKRDRRDHVLSRREREVLDLLAAGRSNKEIADTLEVADSTVKTHLESIFRKLRVNDRTGAVTEGLRRGLIRLPEN